jgi:hypothetical protein
VARKMEHDVVGDTHVMVFTEFVGSGRYKVEARWREGQPADAASPLRVAEHVCNCVSHEEAARITFCLAAKKLGCRYWDDAPRHRK